MMRVLKGMICVGLLLLFGAGAASAQVQTKAQQKCINKVNKDGIKVQATQEKANSACVKDHVTGVLGSTAEACVLDDPDNKVEAKQSKLLNDASEYCDSLSVPPNFGYTSGATASAQSYQAAVDLVHDLFGNPVDDGLYVCDPYEAECMCQRQMMTRLAGYSRALSKAWVRCKKAALEVGKEPFSLGADSASDLEECVTNGAIALSVQADPKSKISEAKNKLGGTVNEFCHKTPNDEFGEGVCNSLSVSALIDCIANRAKCRFCLMVNAVDGLSIDCSAWTGVTCP